MPFKDSFESQFNQALFVWLLLLLSLSLFSWGQLQGYQTQVHWNRFIPIPESGFFKLLWYAWMPTFIHFSFLHLMVNVYLWWDLGSSIESISRRLLIFLFIVSATVSNLCEYLLVGIHFGGLSGVIYALLGFLWVCSYYEPKGSFSVNSWYVAGLIINLLFGISGLIGNYANVAHVSGLMIGAVWGYIYSHYSEPLFGK